jgi:hypothetical protein
MLLLAPSRDRAPRPASSQIQKKAKPRGAQGGATCKVVADVGTIGSRVIKRQAHQSIECALWRRRCDQLHAVPRRFSRGFDGVPRDCAIHSEKQRSGANRSEAGGGSATGYKRPLAGFRAASMVSRGNARARAESCVAVPTTAKPAAHDFVLVTRNTANVSGLGVRMPNPFDSARA